MTSQSEQLSNQTVPSVATSGVGASEKADGNPLSEREREVAGKLVTGATNAEIARELIISPHTVKVHLRNIFEKLDVNSRTEASLVLLQHGWIAVPGVEAPVPDIAEEAFAEPEPLPDVQPSPALWQQLFIAAVALILLAMLIGPAVATRSGPTFGLLTDANRTEFGQTSPLAIARWSARTPLTHARSRHSAVLAGETIYVIGGENADGNTISEFTSYNMRTNRWRTLPPLPIPLANHASVILDDVIYVAGGSANSEAADGVVEVSDQVHAYDLTNETWTSHGRLPTPLAGAGLEAYDGSLYLIGGWDGEKMRGEVWQLLEPGQPSEPSDWKTVAQLATPSAFFGHVIVDGGLYVIGGYDGQREMADAALLDLATLEWQELPAMSAPRSGLSAVYDGMAVFALGGGWTRAINTHERYDALADQWSNFPSPIEGDWRHLAAASGDGRIWLIGGWSGGYLDTHQEYQSAFRSLLPVIQSE